MTTIPYNKEAEYLKHMGKLINVKVTVKIVDGQRLYYVRDLELHTVQQVLQYLRHISESEIPRAEAAREYSI